MPRSYRCAVIAIAVLATLALGVWYGLKQQSAYQAEASNRHPDYRHHAAQAAKSGFLGVPVRDKPSCTIKAAGEYHLQARDNEREYDCRTSGIPSRATFRWLRVCGYQNTVMVNSSLCRMVFMLE
jgi:hypothetical protein